MCVLIQNLLEYLDHGCATFLAKDYSHSCGLICRLYV